MKRPVTLLFPCIFCLVFFFNGKEITNPFKTLAYDKVLAVDFNGEHEMPLVLRNGKLTQEISQRAVLNAKQIDYITGVISDTATYGYVTAACFEPHFGLVFYSHDSIVAHVSICFECNSLFSSVKIPAETYHNITDGDLTLPRHGFSPKGRKAINKLVEELEFSHTIDPEDPRNKE
jgi:hypothetical protein